MANSKLICKHCKIYHPVESIIRHPIGKFCSDDCVMLFIKAKQEADTKRKFAKAKADIKVKEKAARAKHTANKARIKKRTGPKGYYENLKTELHYHVKHCLRKGEPCYTCGKAQSPLDNGGAFHVGHFIPAGSVDPRRFMLENLRMQCYSCNVPNSGRRAEYRQRMIEEMGVDHVEWLECDVNHKELNDAFQDMADIKAETAKYRKLNKPIRDVNDD